MKILNSNQQTVYSIQSAVRSSWLRLKTELVMKEKRVILFGIGNCGRADDGLGWAFLDKIEKSLPDNFDIEYRYQLQVEDAELAAQYDTVYFIDAHITKQKNGYIWKKCVAKPSDSYTSHELNPETILNLTESIYNKKPISYLLGITGEKFDLSMELSKNAKINLTKALDFFNSAILLKTQLTTH